MPVGAASLGARAGRRVSSISRWRAGIALCLLLALLLRVGFVLATRPYPLVGDALDYNRHAQSIGQTGHYPRSIDGPDGGPTAFRPPLYPYFLAPIYAVASTRHAVDFARLAQALLGVAIVGLVGLFRGDCGDGESGSSLWRSRACSRRSSSSAALCCPRRSSSRSS